MAVENVENQAANYLETSSKVQAMMKCTKQYNKNTLQCPITSCNMIDSS